MSHPKPARLLAAFSAAVALSAAAQSAPGGGVRSVVPPAYQSAFEDHKPFSEEEPIAWRVANDTVGKIGGWRAYANEAEQGPGAAPSQATGQRPPAAAPAAAANPHAGHRH